MANRPDPNNPQPGDVFFNLDGDKRTIINRLGDWCWVDCHDGHSPITFGTPMIAREYELAPPMPPDLWGDMSDEGHVLAYVDRDRAQTSVERHDGAVLVHYVGTVVQP